MRQQIELAAKMYKCHDTAKKLFGEEFKDKISWYTELINKYSQQKEKDILPSVVDLCNLDSVKENGMAMMLFMAAAVEILEPAPTTE